MRFTATERFAVDRVAFSWQARFRIAPLVSLSVSDGYMSGRGALKVRLIGIPFQNESGPDVDLGEAYRYVAELPWVPHAIRDNHALDWQQIDERSVVVSAPVGQRRVNLTVDFDPDGDVEGCVAAARPRTQGGHSVPTAWGGLFSDYAEFDGIRMPSRGEVYWDRPQGRFTYWRGEITSARALAMPFDQDQTEGGHNV